MKIIYLHQYFNLPTENGGGRSYEMAKRLVQRGHEVHIISSNRDASERSKKWALTVVDGISIHMVSIPYANGMSTPRRIAAFLSFALRASTYTRSLKGDVVFATSTPLTIAIPAIYSTVFRPTPMVFEVRDLWPSVPIAMGALHNPVLRWLALRLEKMAYRKSARVVALSPGMKEGVVRTGYALANITVIPNAADLDIFANQDQLGQTWRDGKDWLGERPMVLYCGTLGKVNNLSYLVEVAVRSLNISPETRFVVVGSGGEEARIRAEASSRGVLDVNFFMLDPVAKSDVPAIFAAADVCTNLVGPLKEFESNSANKFYDALAASRPIAINYGGWHADLIDEFEFGICLSATDFDLAAVQLAGLLSDSDRLASLGTAAGEIAASQFSRDNLSLKLAEVLEASVRFSRVKT